MDYPTVPVPSSEELAALDCRQEREVAPCARSEGERDRDRVLYSSAFLRLGHVTQVAPPEAGHNFHSRLIHSMKVGQVARGLAQHLRVRAEQGKLDRASTEVAQALDEDSVEAAAFAHDLGHPPFGHLAERVLQKKSKDATFEGNPQSFRIATRLAYRSSRYEGLNLTRRTLNYLLKYPWMRSEKSEGRSTKWGAYPADQEAFDWVREFNDDDRRTLGAELMDWADDVTYAVHDMDDFYRAGLIPLERLTTDEEERSKFATYLANTDQNWPTDPGAVLEELLHGFFRPLRSPYHGGQEERIHLRSLGSTLISRYISSVDLEDRDSEHAALVINPSVRTEVEVLKQLTWYYIINRPSLAIIQKGHETVIGTLFDLFRKGVDRPEDHALLSPAAMERLRNAKGEAAKDRVVIDLIASLTEAGALEIYRQYLGVSTGSLMLKVAG